MNRWIITMLFAALLGKSGIAQRDHFIYLQTEEQQPFYIVYGGVNYSSSAAGHLVLPKMAEGRYKLDIGFPGKMSTTPFFLVVNGTDEGYIIANSGDKLLLKNLLTNETLQPYVAEAEKPVVVQPAKNETVQAATIAPIATVDSIARSEEAERENPAKDNQANMDTALIEPATAPPVATAGKPVVLDKTTMTLEEKLKALEEEETRLLNAYKKGDGAKPTAKKEKNTNDGVPKKQSTPGVVKPGDVVVIGAATEVNASTSKTNGKPADNKATNTRNDRKFLDMEMGVDSAQLVRTSEPVTDAKEQAKAEEKKELPPMVIDSTAKESQVVIIDSVPAAAVGATRKEKPDTVVSDSDIVKPVVAARKPCNGIMSTTDFEKLQKELSAIEDEDDLIYEARKAFKQQCVTTYQVKALSAMAKTDALRYRLLDAAWPYAADYFNYKELRSLLKDDYYITRFDAMIQ